MTDWSVLREKAVAAQRQLDEGPQEWPGRPSQRLELFLEASPSTILRLLDELERR